MATVLAFDTSGPHCSAALLIAGKIVATRHEEMKRGQAERLFPMLDDVLGDIGAVWEELDAIGVGIGPGNFTGIRISVSAARGLSLSLGIPTIGVSTFQAYFEMAEAPDGQVAVYIPGQKGNYFQIFQDGEAKGAPFLEPSDAKPCPPWSQSLDKVVGPHNEGMIYSVTYDFGPAGMTSAPTPVPIQSPTEVTQYIARIAAKSILQGKEYPRPTPLYIRPADAAPRTDPPVKILP